MPSFYFWSVIEFIFLEHEQRLKQNLLFGFCMKLEQSVLAFRILRLHGYPPTLVYVLIECRIQIEIHSVYEWIRIRAREFLYTGLPTGYGSGTPVHFHGNKSFGKKVIIVHNLKSCTFIFTKRRPSTVRHRHRFCTVSPSQNNSVC